MKIKQARPSPSILQTIFLLQDANGASNRQSSWLKLATQNALSVQAAPKVNVILA
jgi:hypothetical protein